MLLKDQAGTGGAIEIQSVAEKTRRVLGSHRDTVSCSKDQAGTGELMQTWDANPRPQKHFLRANQHAKHLSRYHNHGFGRPGG